MYEKVKMIFRSQKQAVPSPETQANIGNLAVHYVNELYTRIERLANSGRTKEAKTENEALLRYFEKLNDPKRTQEPFDTTSCSSSCRLAIEYLEKLFTLLNNLLEANRIQESQTLKVYLDQINRRRELYEKTLRVIARKKELRKK